MIYFSDFAVPASGGGDPAIIALMSENGAYYDPSVTSSLWQDTAKTVPVTADGDLVRVMEDLSGNGYDMVAPSDTSRPAYKTSGGLHWLEPSPNTVGGQSADIMLSTPFLDLGSAWTHVGGWRVNGTTDHLFCYADTFRSSFFRGSSGAELWTRNAADNNYLAITSGGDLSAPCSVSIVSSSAGSLTAWINGGSSLGALSVYNGSSEASYGLALFVNQNDATATTYGGTTLAGRFYGGLFDATAFDSTDRATAEAYFEALAGL